MPKATQAAQQPDRFLRRPSVQDISGLSRSQIYRLMQAGQFPKAINIGERAVAWRESEIHQWMQERIAGRAA